MQLMHGHHGFIALVMPAYYGVGFISAVRRMRRRVLAVVQHKCDPETHRYDIETQDRMTIADVFDASSIASSVRAAVDPGELEAIIPATDYATHSTALAAVELGLFGAPVHAARRGRRKDEARASYDGDPRIRPVRWRVATSRREVEQAARAIGFPVVGKPVDCACSQHVKQLSDDAGIESWWEEVKDHALSYMNYRVHRAFLIEEYVEGPEFSVELFLRHGVSIFSSITAKLRGPLPYFVELGHDVPAKLDATEAAVLGDAALRGVRALGFLDGAFHVELRLSSDGPVIMETNPRPGGDRIATELLPLAFGVDLFGATVEMHLGLPPTLEPRWRRAAAVRYASTHGVGCLRSSDDRGIACVADADVLDEAIARALEAVARAARG